MLPERIREFRAALKLVSTDVAARVTVQRLGHRISGTAATLGMPAVGDVGRHIERFALARPHWTPEDVRRVAGAVDAVETWSLAAVVGMGDDEALRNDPNVSALRAEVGA